METWEHGGGKCTLCVPSQNRNRKMSSRWVLPEKKKKLNHNDNFLNRQKE